MPIEDVDYLIQNSEKDAVTFFVDSSNRNINAYPEPNNFVITFSEPIRNVFGIEVLDATIPVAMWTIDEYNNKLAYSHVFYFNGATSIQFRQYFQELENITVFNTVFDSLAKANIFICLDKDNFNSIVTTHNTNNFTPLAYSQHVVFYRQFYDATMTLLSPGITSVDDPTVITIVEPVTNLNYAISNPSAELYSFLTTPGVEFAVMSDLSGIVTYTFQYITRPEAQNIINLASIGASVVEVYINNEYLTMEGGAYNSTSMMQYLISAFQAVRVGNPQSLIDPQDSFPISTDALSVIQTSQYGTIDKQTKLGFFFPGANNSFILDMKKSTCSKELGFYGHTTEMSEKNYAILSTQRNKQLYFSYTKISNNINQYIQSPGIINLQGIRYILLRIPELESHLVSSYAYGDYSPGIGMFKLTSTNDIAQLRFDFVNLIRKPFHPVGKLSKITLQFYTSRGFLYDFKGVDYNMLLAIKFYAPKSAPRLAISVLNPNYTPDYLAYSVREKKKKDKREYAQKDILLEQNKYDYERDDLTY